MRSWLRIRFSFVSEVDGLRGTCTKPLSPSHTPAEQRNFIDKTVSWAEQTVVQVSTTYCCRLLLLDYQSESFAPYFKHLNDSIWTLWSDRWRKPIPKKPPRLRQGMKDIYTEGCQLIIKDKYSYKSIVQGKSLHSRSASKIDHLGNKENGGWEQRASGTEFQGRSTRMFLQLKILKTTGGTNSNPANPWYWHAAWLERAAAGESDVSLCIQSRNLL